MRNTPSAVNLFPACLGVALIFATPCCGAQTPAQSIVQGPQIPFLYSDCPVSLSASQRSTPLHIETGGATRPAPGQGLTVAMSGRRAGRITSAEVVVHALSQKNRTILTGQSQVDPDVTRNLHLAAKEDGGFNDLWIDGVTSIRSIEVKSITYSNGTIWRETETQHCSARPSPYMLISSVH